MQHPSDLCVVGSNYFLQNRNEDSYRTLIDIISAWKPFVKITSVNDSVTEIIRFINNSLNSSKDCLQSLGLLYLILDQCSGELFEEHALVWHRLLLQMLQSRESGNVKKSACDVIGKLMKYASNSKSLSRDFSLISVPALIPVLLSSDSNWTIGALDCLTHCVLYFPGACGQFKTRIETLLLSLFHEDILVAERAAHCLALLPRCGGSGAQGSRQIEVWSECARSIIGSLHNILGSLYDDIEADHLPTREDCLKITELTSDNEPPRVKCLCQQSHVVCHALISLLTSSFLQPVAVPVKDLFQLFFRALNVTPKVLFARPTTDRLHLAALLYHIHVDFLKILTALIRSIQHQLGVYVGLIGKLLTRTLLSWTQDPVNEVRVQIYETLETWLTLFTPSVDTIIEELLPLLLRDVRLDDVNLLKSSDDKADVVGGLTLSKKKKRRRLNGYEDILRLSYPGKIDESRHVSVCIAALKVLEALLQSSVNLGAQHYKKLHEKLIAFGIQLCRGAGSLHISSSYMNIDCRVTFYRVLLSLILFPHSKCPCPLSEVVRILTTAVRFDSSVEVKISCQAHLSVCETLIHPRAPSLHLPVTFVGEPVQSVLKPSTFVLPANTESRQKDDEVRLLVRENNGASLPVIKTSNLRNIVEGTWSSTTLASKTADALVPPERGMSLIPMESDDEPSSEDEALCFTVMETASIEKAETVNLKEADVDNRTSVEQSVERVADERSMELSKEVQQVIDVVNKEKDDVKIDCVQTELTAEGGAKTGTNMDETENFFGSCFVNSDPDMD